MIDFRHTTFLTLCRTGNFTRAGEELGLTQPAVSQHIQYLEELYGGKLVVITGRRFSLTSRGQKLYDLALALSADSRRVLEAVRNADAQKEKLLFGSTLTIGEYVMPLILRRVFERWPHAAVTMEVGNTRSLLEKLDCGELDFVLLEGFFDKSLYESRLFSLEEFIAVAAPAADFSRPVPFEALFSQRLIVREPGSGTRYVLEQILAERNASAACFADVCEVGNMSAIKQLVASGCGITFLYRAAAQAELERSVLRQITIDGFFAEREFNFVFLKNSRFAADYLRWFDFFKSVL